MSDEWLVKPDGNETGPVPIEQPEAADLRRKSGRTDPTGAAGRLFPGREFLWAIVAAIALAAGICMAGEKKDPPALPTDGAVSSKDDSLLWRAGTSSGYYHNRILVLPETWKQHAEFVNRYAEGKGDDRCARFANTIIAKDAVTEEHNKLVAAERNSKDPVPAELNRSKANAILKTLLGREPAWRELAAEKDYSGIVRTIDELRKTKVSINLSDIYHHAINTLIADQVEAHYRKAIGNRTLPENAGLHIRGQSAVAQISFAGTKPLTNVVVVTRAKMRPAVAQAVATEGLINIINEAADSGADANKVAAQLLATSRVLHESPQGVTVYIPVLEPGDELRVDLYEQGFHWDIMEGKVSVYSDAGAVFDKVVVVGGPHNDLSLTSEERRRLTKPPLKEKPIGPVFTLGLRAEIVLKPDAAGPFERCVPVDLTFLPVGIKDEVEAGKPLEVIARSADAYVAIGPKKLTGNSLVFVPRSLVAKVNVLSKKKPAK